MEPEHLTTPQLERWLAVTRTPLDLLALFTIWLTVLPFTTVRAVAGSTALWWIGRVGLSLVYGIDLLVRARLSAQPRRYVLSHPIALAAVLVPTVRILFSLRLLGAMFRKGNLGHFLFVALVLMLNGVVMVFAFEDRAPGSNIHTLGDSLWWACVTVATVGYGDFYPVTIGGRATAVALMGVGLVSAAVVTAQIASSFMDQAAARRAAQLSDATARNREVVDDVHTKLDRIERLLAAAQAVAEAPDEAPGGGSPSTS
jgi:voltage-gated potassium channel